MLPYHSRTRENLISLFLVNSTGRIWFDSVTFSMHSMPTLQEKMRAQQSKFLASIDTTADAAADDSERGKELCNSDGRPRSEEATPVICSLCHDPNSKSPVSYLILLQVGGPILCVDIIFFYLDMTGDLSDY